jgi:hypothetical protein
MNVKVVGDFINSIRRVETPNLISDEGTMKR